MHLTDLWLAVRRASVHALDEAALQDDSRGQVAKAGVKDRTFNPTEAAQVQTATRGDAEVADAGPPLDAVRVRRCRFSPPVGPFYVTERTVRNGPGHGSYGPQEDGALDWWWATRMLSAAATARANTRALRPEDMLRNRIDGGIDGSERFKGGRKPRPSSS